MTPKFMILGCAAILGMAACSTTPEPVVQPVQNNTAPAPVAPAPAAPAPAPAPVAAAPSAAPVVSQFDPNAPIPGSAEDFAYSAGGEPRVFFDYNRYELSREARQILSQQASWLNQYGSYTATVEGNADERGTREYNLALAARRAESVKSFLVSQGVNPSRLTTVSYGKERPIDARSNEAGWARNRNGFTNLRLSGQS